MESLDKIGIEEASDRSSKFHNYLQQYETFIEKYRTEKIDILEIGGRTSASARMWTRFFPNATLHVIDTHPVPELLTISRVVVHKINHFSNMVLGNLADQIRPTIAIDDGTHKWSHQLAGLHSIFPSISPGGLMIIEDLQTSFGRYEVTHGDTKESTSAFLARCILSMMAGSLAPKPENTVERYLATSLDRVSIIRQAALLHKKPNTEIIFTRDTLTSSSYTITSIVEQNDSYPRVHGELLYASPKRKKSFQRILDAGDAQLPPSASGIVRDVTVYGSGLAVTDDGLILSESLNNIENIDYYADFYKRNDGKNWQSTSNVVPQRVQKVSGRIHVLLKGAWDANYGHWLYDVLPRLSHLEKLNIEEKPLLVISPRSGAMEDVVYETLKLAGYSEEDIIEHDVRPRKYESLVILGRTSRHPILKAPGATSFLEKISSTIPAGENKRIYLSRNAYNRRRITNEDRLCQILESKGFRIVYPEKLAFRDQVSLLKGAELVVGNMGAAFSNLAFSPMNVNVLTLSTPGMPHDFFYDIVCHKQGRYIGVQGTSKDIVPGMGSDFEITEEMLIEGLAKFEV